MCQNLFTWRVVPDRKITLDLVPNVHNERGQLLPQSAEKTFKVLRILNMPWLVPGRRVKQCLEGKTKLTLPTFKASDSPSNVTLAPKPTNLLQSVRCSQKVPFYIWLPRDKNSFNVNMGVAMTLGWGISFLSKLQSYGFRIHTLAPPWGIKKLSESKCLTTKPLCAYGTINTHDS